MTTVKRNWLEEAYKLHAGDKNIKAKKEHVKAAIDSLLELSRKTEKLHSIMHIAYTEACRTRREKGLPIPPIPEALKNFNQG